MTPAEIQNPSEVRNPLTSARFELERICELLVSPSPATLDRCSTMMERVIGELTEGRGRIEQSGETGVAEARQLRAVVHRARSLLILAANYHARWHSILAGMSTGYTVHGVPAPVRCRPRLSLRG